MRLGCLTGLVEMTRFAAGAVVYSSSVAVDDDSGLLAPSNPVPFNILISKLKSVCELVWNG